MPTKRVEVIHTKELINHAFKELLLEKEFDRITVMDISSKAQINRATFYLHFKDKQELYTNYMEYFFYHVDIILHNIMSPTYVNKGLDQFVTKPFPPIAALFSYMKKEEALTNCLLGLKSSRETTLRLEQLLEKYYLRFYKAHKGTPYNMQFTKENDLYERYILKAAMGIIFGWVDEGMRRSSDEMAILFVRISLKM